jgi:small subunit ribosomal protein S17
VIEEPENNETTEEEAPEPEVAPEAEAPAAEPPAEEAPAEEAPAAEEPAAEPAEALSPKQLRKRERSAHTGEALPPRSPDERAGERASRRAKKATLRRARRVAERAKRTPGTGTPPAERAPGTKAVRQGTVISDKADKTITVRLEIVRRHPKYEKIVRRTAKVRAHDENNDAHTGDVVRLIEARPTSKSKRWRLVEVLERAR